MRRSNSKTNQCCDQSPPMRTRRAAVLSVRHWAVNLKWKGATPAERGWLSNFHVPHWVANLRSEGSTPAERCLLLLPEELPEDGLIAQLQIGAVIRYVGGSKGMAAGAWGERLVHVQGDRVAGWGLWGAGKWGHLLIHYWGGTREGHVTSCTLIQPIRTLPGNY